MKSLVKLCTKVLITLCGINYAIGQTSITVSDDVYVINNGSNSINNAALDVRSANGASNARVSYLKFTLPTFGSVSSVQLILHTNSSSFND